MTDLLYEIIFGVLPAKTVATHEILKGKKPLQNKALEAQTADNEKKLFVYYHNQNKTRCRNCGKPNYHKCRIMSGSYSRIAQLYKQAQDSKTPDQPAGALTFTVLVHDENLL